MKRIVLRIETSLGNYRYDYNIDAMLAKALAKTFKDHADKKHIIEKMSCSTEK